ncbi:DarT1-associated NADAR antitoxin family protein [[Collinsella] massiliensis]|uniref:DarT1-associated NADAR antitoxin family protein n=1 Tax=[Collinsella] massiliensis TaxID=1232426 RepID=UPI003D15F5CB
MAGRRREGRKRACIEFNPKRSINCQAEAAAIFVSLSRQGLLRDALESEDGFREIVFQGVASETAADPAGGQGHLF